MTYIKRINDNANKPGTTAEDKSAAAFMQLLAHELRNPMAALINLAALIKAREQAGKPVGNLADQLQEEVWRLSSSIDKVLHFFTAGNDAATYKMKYLDIRQVLNKALARYPVAVNSRFLVHQAENEKGIGKGRGKGKKKAPFIIGDAEKLEEMLGYILDNAVKYSPPESPVHIAWRQTGRQVILSIRDHGIGVPRKERQRVFDCFFRAENARRHDQHGMGLSLYFCRRIVTAHGGRIKVSGRPPWREVLNKLLPRQRRYSSGNAVTVITVSLPLASPVAS